MKYRKNPFASNKKATDIITKEVTDDEIAYIKNGKYHSPDNDTTAITE